MPYTANNPSPSKPVEELRQQIPGWGADLDPADRPSVPRERKDVETGAHWDFPERQEEKQRRERSIEHRLLPPVFGTSIPLKGLSGTVRRLAYNRYSEARAAHWLLLLAGDRIDAWESHLRSFATMRPDNPLTETGLIGEVHGHGVRSRLGAKRADLAHQWMDPAVVAGPWLLAAAAATVVIRALKRRRA